MPRDRRGAAETLQWIVADLNSIEMVSVPWWFIGLSTREHNTLEDWLVSRLQHLETVLAPREWLAADRFTAADLLMADVLRARMCAGSDISRRSYPISSESAADRHSRKPGTTRSHISPQRIPEG